MDAPSIRAELARLAEAGERIRAIPLDERVERLQDVLDRMAEPKSAIRDELGAELPSASGFTRETVRTGLDLALRRWRDTGLRDLVRGELGARADLREAPHSTAVVAGGAIPMPTLEAMIAPLVLGSTVVVRPARRDPVTARRFREILLQLDDALGSAVAICGTERGDDEALDALLEVGVVVASGSDSSVATIREHVNPRTRFVGYGHRLSVAVVGSEPGADELAALALDASLWDQLGCLSPLAVFALGHSDAWARGLAGALDRASSERPRGEVPLEAAAAIGRERDLAELRGAEDERIQLHAGADWTVIREADARWRSSPLHRFVRVHPVADERELAGALGPIQAQLSTVGFGRGLDAAAARLAPRSAPLGSMQTPPLHWNHDGIGTLRPLLGLLPRGG